MDCYYPVDCGEFSVTPMLVANSCTPKCYEEEPACYPCLPRCTKPVYYCCEKKAPRSPPPPRTAVCEDCCVRPASPVRCCAPRSPPPARQESCPPPAPAPAPCCNSCCPPCKPVKTKYIIPCYRYEDGRIVSSVCLTYLHTAGIYIVALISIHLFLLPVNV